jgi:WD40 repeat protein
LDIKFSRDGRLVATGSNNGGDGITIRDASDGKELRRIKNPQLSYVLMFTPDDKLLFSAGSSLQEGDESPVFVYNVDTGRTIGVWKGHHEAVRSLAISPDGKMLASGGDDRVISIWEIPSGLRLAAWEAHKTDVTALSFSVDGRTLVSGSADGALKLWDLPRIHRELSALGLEW